MKVLVVDDSALMRKYLRQMLEKEHDMEVVTARDGQDALDKLVREKPDVITLDINMPIMDGLTCLGHIMKERPTAVVMVSSLTEKGAVATFEALELGAVDFIPKPDGTVSRNIAMIEDEIIRKVRAAASIPPGRAGGLSHRLRARREKARARRHTSRSVAMKASTGKAKIVLVGVSTGGPRALEAWLPQIPADFPLPIIIAQHMPGSFTAVFAQRMDSLSQIHISEVNGNSTLQAGSAWIARGGADVTLSRKGREISARSVPQGSRYIWHPSVSRMVSSAASILSPEEIICVQLTGMGDDGAKEMSELYKHGARTIAESEETAAIFGMPERLISMGGGRSSAAGEYGRQAIDAMGVS